MAHFFLLLSSNTVPLMKSLIVIILVVKEPIFFGAGIVVSGGWGWGWGRRWLVEAQSSVPSAPLPKQQSLAEIGFHGTLFLSFFYFKLLIGGHC